MNFMNRTLSVKFTYGPFSFAGNRAKSNFLHPLSLPACPLPSIRMCNLQVAKYLVDAQKGQICYISPDSSAC